MRRAETTRTPPPDDVDPARPHVQPFEVDPGEPGPDRLERGPRRPAARELRAPRQPRVGAAHVEQAPPRRRRHALEPRAQGPQGLGLREDERRVAQPLVPRELRPREREPVEVAEEGRHGAPRAAVGRVLARHAAPRQGPLEPAPVARHGVRRRHDVERRRGAAPVAADALGLAGAVPERLRRAGRRRRRRRAGRRRAARVGRVSRNRRRVVVAAPAARDFAEVPSELGFTKNDVAGLAADRAVGSRDAERQAAPGASEEALEEGRRGRARLGADEKTVPRPQAASHVVLGRRADELRRAGCREEDEYGGAPSRHRTHAESPQPRSASLLRVS